ncbi:class I adenylate-forming enzyme family protein [Thiohalomonas denitrificans]|uniref:Acyl-CoA synthetase (AMP-forming)/AMP-acid ligase II n=1 Tax=Thiohalomonas denitrificans TaxID=415747 RepID=A0A1G5Q2D9_9GAMM|nr:AMP-binding protein [Thiohalomonas denitrificans]SCZ55983.1 Acyl-CoA synthetase (AMP-forming)/AMP-acid ligase II [Thiohalomonas denitrificans]
MPERAGTNTPGIQRLVHDALVLSSSRSPEKVAVIADSVPHSYRELWDSARRLAGTLQSRGVRPGDRVLLWLENGWAAAVSIYAVWIAGGVLAVINPQTKPDKFLFIAKDSQATALIGEAKLVESLGDATTAVASLGYTAVSGESAHFERIENIIDDPASPLIEPQPVIATDLAALIYTSGSTGEPKGVMQNHQSMVFASTSIIEYLRLSKSDRVLCVLPLAFDYGLYQLLMSVQLGATLILERSFVFPGQVLARLEKERATVFPGVPTLFANLIDGYRRNGKTFPFVQRVTNTAAALPEGFIAGLQEVFPKALVFSMYGLTECKRATWLDPEQLSLRPGSVGKAIPGTEAFVLRDDGSRAEPGETGILHVRGPHVMLGYWRRPEQTARMLRPGYWPGERMLCTQDLFRSDEHGFLYFVGRSDDVIKSRGEKVSPVEVERALCRIEGVHQAAVLGVEDPILGQAIWAFVEPDGTNEITSAHLKAGCSERLEPFMVPKRFEIMDQLPRTANGKVDKQHLSAEFAQTTGEGAALRRV